MSQGPTSSMRQRDASPLTFPELYANIPRYEALTRDERAELAQGLLQNPVLLQVFLSLQEDAIEAIKLVKPDLTFQCFVLQAVDKVMGAIFAETEG